MDLRLKCSILKIVFPQTLDDFEKFPRCLVILPLQRRLSESSSVFVLKLPPTFSWAADFTMALFAGDHLFYSL